MAHFNPEGVVTRLEVEAPSRLLAKARHSKDLMARLLGAQQSEPKLSETPILELVDVAPEPTDGARPDPLLQGLVGRLPKPDSVWSLDDRGKWLRAAAIIFTLIYKLDERDSSGLKELPLKA